MNTYEAMIDRARHTEVTINLLLTTQCSFACRHCFFGCSPKGSLARPDLGIAYMSNDVLAAVRQQVERLRELDIRVEINLIGGEPTLRLDRFTEIVDYVSDWDIPFHMTTNGWWLQRADLARKFFQAIKRFVNSNGTADEGFSVRISEDRFHREWRKRSLPKNIADLWTFASDYDNCVYDDSRMVWRCNNCSCEHEEEVEACDHCGCTDLYHDIDSNAELLVPEPNSNDAWIYIENQDGSEPIMSGHCQVSGRELNCDYNSHYDLGYEPDGALMDICCDGSYLRAGTVHDDPVDLLILADMFLIEKKPRCGTCMEDAREWVDERLEEARASVRSAREEYEDAE